MAADVYALSPHLGRGGWTWYTGSAGWMYNLITESLLGLKVQGDRLFIEPCIPEEWETYKICYRYKETIYRITFTQNKGAGTMLLKLDGADINEPHLTMIDDRVEHTVEVTIFSGETIKNI
jgi:cellobiose phosphorylase